MSGHDDRPVRSAAGSCRARFTMRDAVNGVRPGSRPAVALLVAIALYAVLNEPLPVGPRFLIPALELWLTRQTRHTRRSRVVSLVLTVLVVMSNPVLLVVDLIGARTPPAAAC
jgi:hypothetical protein